MKINDAHSSVGCYPYFFGRERRTGLRLEATGIRNRGILNLFKDRTDGDMMAATLEWDFNHAQVTTNAAQLREIGMENPLGTCDAELAQRRVGEMYSDSIRSHLVETIEALADLGIYLLGTNGYDDGELLVMLWTNTLQEPVRDLPPSCMVSEYIDFSSKRDPAAMAADRDQFLPRAGGRQ